jgi:hypothetical protein
VKFNITKKELKRALKYAKKNGQRKFKTITMELHSNDGFGPCKKIYTQNDKGIDITDTKSY